jgi:hypothetical protein
MHTILTNSDFKDGDFSFTIAATTKRFRDSDPALHLHDSGGS